MCGEDSKMRAEPTRAACRWRNGGMEDGSMARCHSYSDSAESADFARAPTIQQAASKRTSLP
jgi:hypothetical protein